MIETLTIQAGECWWGGCVADAHSMPWTAASRLHCDLRGNAKGGQAQPLLLSNHGRIVWCDEPFDFSFDEGVLTVRSSASPIVVARAGTSLREAVCRASMHFFPPDGQLPDGTLFTQPQYNTWIELQTNQHQEGVLEYARGILRHGFPPGVLIIDDTWQEDYGTWRFSRDRFPDPRHMVRELHAMGFRVMLWICPFVNPDAEDLADLAAKDAVFTDAAGNAAEVRWWNGSSALLNLTQPEAVRWLKSRLANLSVRYSIDGFKFDAGDPRHYAQLPDLDRSPNDHTVTWASLGLDYPLNEFRACWKMGGRRLAQRLRDKAHRWEALQQLIPEGLVQGMLGYPFSCPDMIGGGEISSFGDNHDIDQDLLVRSAQCSAYFPMMQFSVAPWRVLDDDHLRACRAAAERHAALGSTLWALAKVAAHAGVAILRHLDYEFPGHGFADCRDQFMLGKDLMIAPLVQPDCDSRQVRVPPGTWTDDQGTVWHGPCTCTTEVPLERIPTYRRMLSPEELSTNLP